jgi:hypothetical protein
MARKIHTIYKEDKWNMITAEIVGSKITVREISSLWGEDTYTFYSRPELMNWVKQHYKREDYEGREDIYESIVENFQNL